MQHFEIGLGADLSFTFQIAWYSEEIPKKSSLQFYNFLLQSFLKLQVVRHDIDTENIPVFVGRNIHLSNETIPMQLLLKVFNSLSSLQAAKTNQLPVR